MFCSKKKNIVVIILAAGAGTRMKSSLPKVLHKLYGKPLLHWVLDAVNGLFSVEKGQEIKINKKIIICGFGAEKVIESCKNKYDINNENIDFVLQKERLGTAHAVLQTLKHIECFDRALILSGDVPLINSSDIRKIIETSKENEIAVATSKVENPYGFGRILKNENGEITKIIEEKDAGDKIRKINEINAGIYIFPTSFLQKYLPKIETKNSQKEYYLTDLISIAVNENYKISLINIIAEGALGINDRYQLYKMEKYLQMKKAKEFMEKGVSFFDINTFYVRTDDIRIGKDVVIDVNVILEGKIEIKDGAYIGPNTYIKDSVVFENVKILSNCVIEGAKIYKNCQVGPFARIRLGTILDDGSKVGNFVEIKKTKFGKNSKASHLSYLGDATLGENVNVGAGTITCNYDGKDKHETKIDEGAFIGSNTSLVAPLKVGKNVTVGAGTTLTKDVKDNALAIARVEQKVIEDWKKK